MGQDADAPFLNVTSMETSDGSKTNWWISTSISTSNLNSTSTSLQHHQGAVGLELAAEEGDLATGWLEVLWWRPFFELSCSFCDGLVNISSPIMALSFTVTDSLETSLM